MTQIKLSWDLLVLAALCGVVLSCVYCALLWYSVQKLPKIKHKGLFLFISSALRLILFVVVAFFLAIHHPALLLSMLATFVITRFVIVKIKGAPC